MSETYPFPGALTCYKRAMLLLAWMGENGYVTKHKNKKGRTTHCTVDPDMDRLVHALNKGDEETIKSYMLDPRFFDIVHPD